MSSFSSASRSRRHALLASGPFWASDRGSFRYEKAAFGEVNCVSCRRRGRYPASWAFDVCHSWRRNRRNCVETFRQHFPFSLLTQEMLYGIQTGFGSPQVPVAELLARPAPSLHSPQSHRGKSSNFLQVPDIESRPKSVPSSPMVKRAFSRLGTITAGWGRSIRSKQHSQLHADDKKKWASSQDCSGKLWQFKKLKRKLIKV